MNRRLAELYLQQGRLLERIAMQRVQLRQQLTPVERAVQRTDAALAALQRKVQTLKNHPLTVALAALVLILLKPKRAWVWGKRGLLLWRSWQLLRRWLPLRLLWR